MKNLIIFIGLLFISKVALGQPYFSKVYDFDFPNVVFTSMVLEDDSVVITGIITDTLAPLFRSIIVKFENNGSVISKNKIEQTVIEKSMWNNNLSIFQDTLFLNMTTVFDTVIKSGIITFNLDGNIRNEFNIINPDYPSETFTRPTTVLEIGEKILFFVSYSTEQKGARTDVIFFILNNKLEVLDTFFIKSESTSAVEECLYFNNSLFFGKTDHNLNYASKDFFVHNIIQKRDTNFNIIWEYKTPLDSLMASRFSMAMTPDSGIVVATWNGNEFYVNPGSNGYCVDDVVVFKVNKYGDLDWWKIIEEEGCSTAFNKRIQKVQILDDGSILICGGGGSEDVGGIGGIAGQIIKLDSEGELLWQRFHYHPEREPSFHFFRDMEVLPNGDIILCGESIGPQAGWLMRVDSMGCLLPGCHTSIAKIKQENPILISVSPNPTSDQLIVHAAIDQKYRKGTFTIVDISGNELLSWENSTNDLTSIINVADFPKGTFLIQYRSHGQILQTKKFIKQ